ncbi:hypothetical protein BH09SUM1_BH09SUM1_27730 [soil metagenome]
MSLIESITRPRSTEGKRGFKFSLRDGIVIVAGAACSFGLRNVMPELSVGILAVVAVFFLFCNVFRVASQLEYSWCAVLAIMTILFESGVLGTSSVIIAQAIATVACIGVQLMSPYYHGVGWQWLAKRRS